MIPRILSLILVAAAVALSGCGSGTPAADRAADRASIVPAAAVSCPHGVPPGDCFICDPALRDPGRLWCREHARYEDRCWLCHPDLRDASRMYCEGHGLYEDECRFCNPALAAPDAGKGESRRGYAEPGGAGPDGAHPDGTGSRGAHPDGAGSHAGGDLYCAEHRVAELECGICQPALADGLRPGEGLKIRLGSPESAQKAGVVTRVAAGVSASESITVPGELAFNANRLVRLTPLVDGIVRKIHVDLGSDVRRGDPMVELTSAAAAEAHAAFRGAAAELREAEARLERESTLQAQGVSSAREVEEARTLREAALGARAAAAERLRELGLDEAAAGADAGEAGSTLILRAPFDGTVTERRAVPGDVVQSGTALVTLCDLDMLWLNVAVSEAVAARLQLGSPVTVTLRDSERSARGRITWIASELDPATRRVSVRAEIPNPHRALRAGAFVEATIDLGAVDGATALERGAVHRFGGNPFVFVEREPDLYELRCVKLGPETDEGVLVTAGLDPGDRVVVGQSYLLKSEFQKSRLGAGCVD